MSDKDCMYLCISACGLFLLGGILGYRISHASHPAPHAPRTAVKADPSPSTWWCNGTLGDYTVDKDFPGRIHAWIHAEGFRPGMTVILRTENARRTK